MKKTFLLALCVIMIGCGEKATTLTIVHTNDTHSQVEPREKDNEGGYARRMGEIAQLRAEDPQLLLVDAGDFCQGTPYFNFFHGRVEVDALNKMGYDAATIGNHEFDNGLDSLAMVVKRANFPIVCANYDFTGTPLEGLVKPYTIVRKGGLKIGIFGIGVDPESLISEKNTKGMRYLPPYEKAQEMADLLRNDKHCDVVVCLSHLGTYPEAEFDKCDAEMAAETRNIDVIIGGHTHKVYDNLFIRNLDGDSILVTQMGKSGTKLGKIKLNLIAK